jgi:hypothetical protein
MPGKRGGNNNPTGINQWTYRRGDVKLYHGTPAGNEAAIRREGLRATSERPISLTTDRRGAAEYASGGPVLEVRIPREAARELRHVGPAYAAKTEVTYPESIPAGWIRPPTIESRAFEAAKRAADDRGVALIRAGASEARIAAETARVEKATYRAELRKIQ